MSIKRSIRQSQLISPWGVGQMINFPGEESLMVAGLDAWEQQYNLAANKEEFIIHEDRLQKRLKVDHFQIPPDFRENTTGILNPGLHVPCVRFPLWHYCPSCGSMEKLSPFQSRRQTCKGIKYDKGVSCHNIAPKKRRTMIPIRFVAVCENGHMEDFPFVEWVHHGQNCPIEGHLRYFIRRSTSALGAIQISCSCGIKPRTMARSFNNKALNKIKLCSGKMPWLGEYESACGKDLQVVQRGAANVYFPQIVSSIFISEKEDPNTKKLLKILEENWAYLKVLDENKHLDKKRFDKLSETKLLSVEEADKLYRLGLEKVHSENSEQLSEEEFRKSEYDVLTAEKAVMSKDFVMESKTTSSYESPVDKYFSKLAIVRKLRETRVLTGFTRLQPNDKEDVLERKKTLHTPSTEIDWLPAIIVRGEGIFLEFRDDLLEVWLKKKGVQDRIKKLNLNLIKSGLTQAITPQYALLHTFSHLIINQLGLICGYNTSSLRERIYCNIENTELKMNGVLIYTASADSEGSLGGLVKQGKPMNLNKIITSALQKAEWCSSDPVCIQSAGQGPGSCNLAACHNCALLPETSCERGNKVLDRALIIGTIDDPDIAFFKFY